MEICTCRLFWCILVFEEKIEWLWIITFFSIDWFLTVNSGSRKRFIIGQGEWIRRYFKCGYHLITWQKSVRVLNKTPLTFNWISRHLVHESPFWWEGHGSSFVVDASVVFQRIPSEYSLLHLFCPVYGRKIKHSNVFWQFKKIIEKITLMLKNLNESACLIAIYLIFLQKRKKNEYFVNGLLIQSNPPCAMTVT